MKFLTTNFFQYSSSLQQMFLTIFLVIFMGWYSHYHWKRRKLYLMSRQRKGPLALPLIGSALYFIGSTKDILNNIIKLANDYESPVPAWLGNRLFFAIYDPKSLEIVLTHPNALAKSDLYHYLKAGVGEGIFTADVPKWKKNRKIIVPTFNQKLLDSFLDIFTEQSLILNEQLEKEVDKKDFDGFNYVSRCTLDIICRPWKLATEEFFNVLFHFEFIFNMSSLARELNDILPKMHRFIDEIIVKRRAEYKKSKSESKIINTETPYRSTFLEKLIELSENGADLPDVQIRDEVFTLTIAGSETSASVISFTLMVLGLFPEIQQKVYEEAIGILGHDRNPKCEDLPKFTYLEKVLKETMRLFPVGPVFARQATGDIKLETCTIPEGASIVILPIVVQRDPKFWKDPLRFDPERFSPEEMAKRNPYAWIPFSGGPRNCIGIKYGFMAMKCVITSVIRKYKISTSFKSIEDIQLQADISLKPTKGYMISVKQRV